MIAPLEHGEDGVSSWSGPSIAADALARIPTTSFIDIGWAKRSIAACTSMLVSAAAGDRGGVLRWMDDARSSSGAKPLYSVLCAVCDAVVADAFHAHGDITSVAAFITSLEGDVLGMLTAARLAEESNALNDPATAALAAGLVRVVLLHDTDTATHLEATAALARRIAQALQLPDERVTAVELAARLHDIGNVAVDRSVLGKPGALSADEWTDVRRHAEAGASALEEIPRLAFLAPIVRAHHERIDGTGYPDRLRGSDIPLESRIIAVAGAFHAMTTQRPYRAPRMPNDALAILADHSGTQYDAEVVDATFRIFRYARGLRRRIA